MKQHSAVDASPTWPRAAAVLGGVLVVASPFLEGPEAEDGMTAAATRAFYEKNLSGIALQVFGEVLFLIGIIVLTVGLVSLMRRISVPAFLVDLTMIGGTLTAVWMWVSASIDMIPLVMVDDADTLSEYGDSAVLSLDLMTRLVETLGDIATVPRGVFVLAVSIAVVTYRFLPRWIGYVGLLVGAASLVGSVSAAWPVAPVMIAWFVGLFGFLLWTLMVTVTLLVQAARSRRGAGSAAHDPLLG